MMPDLYAFGILPRSPIKPGQLQRLSNDRRTEVPILRVKEVDALTKNPALEVVLDTEPLSGVHSAETLLQLLENVLIHGGARAISRFLGELKIHLSPLAPLPCANPQGEARWFDQRRTRAEIAANARRRIVHERQRS